MDFTGERYVPEIEGQIRYEHLHRYALCLQLVAGKTVLDIASGEGYGSALLAAVAKSVTGVDIDASTVDHARHLYYRPNLTFLAGGCDKIPLPDNSFDVVTSFETIEHHDKHEEMLDEIKRVLKPGGVLVISSPNRLTYSDEPGYKNPFHVKELYYDEFNDLLRRRFKSIRMFGQRLAAGSFVFPLGTSGGADLKSLTGDSGEIREHVRELPSPIYFVAICSDDPAIQDRDVSSVYFDRSDDLFKTLEKQRVNDIRQMQEQVRRGEEEIEYQKRGYEAEIVRLNEELRTTRSVYEEALSQLEVAIANRDQQITERDDAIARLTAHWAASEKNIRDHAKHIRAYESMLSDAQTQLGRHIEVLSRIYASRSWRIGSKALKQVERVNERFSKSSDLFKGELDTPQSSVANALTIRGWAYSAAAPITLVEAFLDDYYLGSIRYGEERPDIAGAPLQCGYKADISLHGFNFAGQRVLKVQVHDRNGNRQVFKHSVNVPPESQPKTESAVVAEIFKGNLEYPEEARTVSDSIEVAGWIYSKAAPIIFVEAFLGEVYLGRVSYGIERPDVLSAFPMDAPLRCGFRKSFSLSEAASGHAQSIRLRFYDSQGNTEVVKRVIDIERATVGSMDHRPQSSEADVSRGDRPPQELEETIAQIQQQFGHDPSILDWNSGLNIHRAFSSLPVFSPPIGGNALPYLDHTIDIVVMSSEDPACVAEARRVTSGAVIRVSNTDSSEIEWHVKHDEKPLETVSIIIPVYNQVNYTQNCLEQLIKTLPREFRGEILVIDDASSDETPVVLKKYSETDTRIKVLRNTENAGFIANCNRAAKEAAGEILVFLNNDTLPQPGWLPPLLWVLREKSDAGAAGGKLIYPDGTLQEAGGLIFSDASGCNFGKHDKAANAPLYSFIREVDYCSGALLATPRKLFLELGGFDTRFKPAYYEDADYCFSLRSRGYRVYYQPESVVVHFEGATSGTDITTGVKSYQAANRKKFIEKWRAVLPNQPSPPKQYDRATLQALASSGRRHGN